MSVAVLMLAARASSMSMGAGNDPKRVWKMKPAVKPGAGAGAGASAAPPAGFAAGLTVHTLLGSLPAPMDMLDARAASISTATLILARNCGLGAIALLPGRAHLSDGSGGC